MLDQKARSEEGRAVGRTELNMVCLFAGCPAWDGRYLSVVVVAGYLFGR